MEGLVDLSRQTRRQILKVAIGGAAGGVLTAPLRCLAARPAQRVAQDGENLKLSRDLFVVRLPGEANVVAQTGSNSVLLVDGGSASASGGLIKAVSGLPGGGPVHTIFNTHWHPEQTGSNERLGKAGKTIVPQSNTRP